MKARAKKPAPPPHEHVWSRIQFGWLCSGGDAPCFGTRYAPLPAGARTVAAEADAARCAHCGAERQAAPKGGAT